MTPLSRQTLSRFIPIHCGQSSAQSAVENSIKITTAIEYRIAGPREIDLRQQEERHIIAGSGGRWSRMDAFFPGDGECAGLPVQNRTLKRTIGVKTPRPERRDSSQKKPS